MTFTVCPGYVITQAISQPQGHYSLIGGLDDQHLVRTVVAVGPSLTTDFAATIQPPCQVGQTILVTGQHETGVRIKGEQYFVANFQEVISVLEDYAQNPA